MPRTRVFILFALHLCCCMAELHRVPSQRSLPIVVDASSEGEAPIEISTANGTNNEKETFKAKEPRCKYDIDIALIRNNATLRTTCCDDLYRIFRFYWNHSTIKLGDHLRALKRWHCPVFEEECANRYYGFSEYTQLVYDRFCTPHDFANKCERDVRKVLRDPSFLSLDTYSTEEQSGEGSVEGGDPTHEDSMKKTANIKWLENVHSEHLRYDLTMEEQENSCVQAALVNVLEFSAGRYFEVKQGEIAFCDITWCAFKADTFKTNDISDSSCMPSRCQINIYIMMAAAGFLGVVIVLTNATVLIIFGMNRRLMNSQGIYKMSLAAADLLVGLFVFPTFIETMRRSFLSQYKIIDSDVLEYGWGSGTNGTRLVVHNFDKAFYGFAGFWTNLSLVVSMYSLMIASFDRLLVVYRPLEYNQFRARSVAKKCVAILWIFGIVYSVLPFFVPDLIYMRVASILVCLGGGEVALILYAVTFAVPLLLVWSVNIATFTYSKKNAKVRPKIRLSEESVLSVNLEVELAKTLSIMVGVFTLCILPVAIVLVTELFLDGIHYQHPRQFHQSTAVTVMSLEAVAAFILMSNSLWNFFIYNVRSKAFRACFLALCVRVRSSCCNACTPNKDSTTSMFNFSSSNAQAASNKMKTLTLSTRIRFSGNTA